MPHSISRRDMLKATGASVAALGIPGSPLAISASAQEAESAQATDKTQEDTRARRMEWWHAAKFGMFIHFGVYSSIERHEWVMEDEAWPIGPYTQHAANFKPAHNCPQAWAKLAKQAGMKYMVLTTKHHEGFCNFDTKLTNYCAPKQGPGRDVVREYVDAARAEGLHVGFYYSLMDWHHPDGACCATDEAARRRFVDYTHGLIREILTNYGKIDVLWYDVAWPLDAAGWESEKMNQMVFQLQPEIIVNNRNKLQGDFSTPEQKIVAETNGRAWESCMTLNDSWGYQRADDNWKSSRTVIRNLIQCVRDGGNYLLNIGPKPDGSIPEESVKILSEVGRWMDSNGHTIYKSDLCQMRRSNYASFTRTGNTLYMHVHFWPGEYVAISGLKCKVISARILKTGAEVKFTQDDFQTKFTGLPEKAPDYPVTTIAIECDAEPTQDTDYVRKNKPRDGV
ncbi:alpha-L-fucosidase [Acidobacterium sp. S8]|uniref:alpha-L-fucosidase n=1 Tax=Acidobacterium sp. S8 TaxID=1641854 RepID=UPI0020B12ECF|nr:alpha-L-fucosidase [Acidobacterium sp. S8]